MSDVFTVIGLALIIINFKRKVDVNYIFGALLMIAGGVIGFIHSAR